MEIIKQGLEECPYCNGKGTKDVSGILRPMTKTCTHCKGNGKVYRVYIYKPTQIKDIKVEIKIQTDDLR